MGPSVSTGANASDGSITADQFLQFIINKGIDSPKMFEILCVPVNSNRYRQLLSRIDRVNTAPRPRRMNTEKWEGRKNRTKGKIFESVVGVLLRSVEPFTAWTSVKTTTSEIDWVVQIGPTGLAIQALREWGTHFLCECKFSHEHVSIQWITNLNTVLESHNATVGLLFATRGLGSRGNSTKARHQIDILSVMAQPRFIVCVTGEDLHSCASGLNFLQLVSQRYMEAKAHTGRLKLLRH
jgi:hypothetical protein